MVLERPTLLNAQDTFLLPVHIFYSIYHFVVFLVSKIASTRVGIVPPCRLTPRVGSRHGGTFPTRGDAILRNVKPVIPGVLVARGNWFNLSYDSITSVS